MLSLLLNLVGSQSWGTSSYFKFRDAGTEPTKSAVFGMIESAMGLEREAFFPALQTLRFGVREDRPGYVAEDFQTAQSVAMARGYGTKNEIIYKSYLADAHFMVVLEGSDEILLRVHNILLQPKRAMHLGRRAFSPLSPIILPDSLQKTSLETVLETYPWCASHLFTWPFPPPQHPLRVVIDDPHGFEIRHDCRLGAPAARQFTIRRVLSYTVPAVWAEPVRFSLSEPENTKQPISTEEPMVKTPEQLYESVLRFCNPVFDIENYNNLHKFVLTALGGKTATGEIPVLFRLDIPEAGEYLLRVRSDRPAAWQKIGEVEILDESYRKYDLKLQAGDIFAFDIRVSPVKKRNARKIRITEPEQQLAWFKRRATQFCGFEITGISNHTVEESAKVIRGKYIVMFSSVVFTGTGIVANPQLFEKFLWRGVAPNGRFVGFGMPLIQPASSVSE